MTVVVVIAVAGVLAAWVPGRLAGRSERVSGGPDRGPGRWPGRHRLSWAGLRGRLRSRRRPAVPDVAGVISEVAARLRSGAPVERAWSAAVGRLLGPDQGADATAADDAETGLPAGLRRLGEACRGDPAALAAVRAVAAATRLSRTTGAPLAGVLDRCVATIVEAERAHDARRIALAGPRSTARILTGLPLLGVVLGAGLGADPVATALDGGWGTVSVAAGGALLYGGARWSAALVRAAEAPGGRLRRRGELLAWGRTGVPGSGSGRSR